MQFLKSSSPSLGFHEYPSQQLDTDVSSGGKDCSPGRLVANHHRICQHKVRNAALQAKTAFSSLMRHAIHTCVLLASSPQESPLPTAPIFRSFHRPDRAVWMLH